MNDKLSPNIAPPIMDAIINASDNSVSLPIPKPIGAKATIVPTEVPIASEIKHPMTNRPTTKRLGGM